jgi:hypothetical protein
MWLKSTIVRTNEQNKRTITRSQGCNREVGSEGRLGETCELMDKKCIQGRRRLVSWHHTAKPFSSSAEVNVIVVQGSTVFLPGEASLPSFVWFQSTGEDEAAVAEMSLLSNEESAEGIVVASEPVSSRRVLRGDEECGQRLRSKARTGGAVNDRQSLCLQATLMWRMNAALFI